jgi:hypothetical protein
MTSAVTNMILFGGGRYRDFVSIDQRWTRLSNRTFSRIKELLAGGPHCQGRVCVGGWV